MTGRISWCRWWAMFCEHGFSWTSSIPFLTGPIRCSVSGQIFYWWHVQWYSFTRTCEIRSYSKTCVREPSSRLTLNSGWCGKSCPSYKGTCHVILLAKLHDMYLYKTTTFPQQPLRSISKVAVLHRFYCRSGPSMSTFAGKTHFRMVLPFLHYQRKIIILLKVLFY